MKFFLLQCGCRVGLVWVFFPPQEQLDFDAFSMAAKKNQRTILQHSPGGVKLGVFLGGVIYGMVGCRGSTATEMAASVPATAFSPFQPFFFLSTQHRGRAEGAKRSRTPGGPPGSTRGVGSSQDTRIRSASVPWVSLTRRSQQLRTFPSGEHPNQSCSSPSLTTSPAPDAECKRTLVKGKIHKQN